MTGPLGDLPRLMCLQYMSGITSLPILSIPYLQQKMSTPPNSSVEEPPSTTTILVVLAILAFLIFTYAIQDFITRLDNNRRGHNVPDHLADSPQYWKAVLKA